MTKTNDYLQKAYCCNGTARIYVATTTNLCSHAQQIHNLWPTSAAALGRTLTIAAIMSCTYKSNEHLTIKVCGDGPIGQITVETTDGNVRGFCHNPGIYLSYNNGKLNVADGVGRNGYIEVIKDLHMRQPFSSTCEIKTGEIADDFTYYFAASEQIPSAVGLGVLVDPDSHVLAAGGFLLQIMPGCKEEDIAKLEKRLASIRPVSEMIHDNMTPEEIMKEITNGDYQLLETKELHYTCPCSKERFAKGIASLGKKEIQDIINSTGIAEVKCNFCTKDYLFSKEDLENLIPVSSIKETT